MDIWAIYAIGASFLWALVNISDQYLISKYSTGKHGSGALVLFSSLVGVFIAFIISIFSQPFLVTDFDKIILIIAGALSTLWIIFYFYSIEIEDISVITPWFLTVPIFGYLFGYFLLGETLTYQQIAGSIIILVGLIVLNINFSTSSKLKFNKQVILYMCIACAVIAIQGVLFKFVTTEDKFLESSFWEYVGLGITGIFIYFFNTSYRTDFKRMIKEGGRQIVFLNMTSESLTIIGNLLTSFALLFAPVTIIYLLGSLQPAFVLILTVLGTIFFPKIVSENISVKVLIPKVIAIVVMIVGSYILFL